MTVNSTVPTVSSFNGLPYGAELWMFAGVGALLIALYFGINFLINKRYPYITFLTEKPGVGWIHSYRLDGTRVIEGDVFQLIMGKGSAVTDKKYFEAIYLTMPGMLPGLNKQVKVYKAIDVNGLLFPIITQYEKPLTRMEGDKEIPLLKEDGTPITGAIISPETAQTLQRLASRQFDAIKFVDTIVAAQTDFFAHMAAIVPFIIITLIFVGAFWAISSISQESLSKTAANGLKASEFNLKTAAINNGIDPRTIPGLPDYNASVTYEVRK